MVCKYILISSTCIFEGPASSVFANLLFWGTSSTTFSQTLPPPVFRCPGKYSWVAHKSAADCIAREGDLPAIFHKTWQAEKPDFLLFRTWQTSACHYGSPSGLPTNCDTPFSTLPKSLTSLTVQLPAHLCSGLPILNSHGNKRILLGTWWEQEEFDGIILGTWWEQKEIDGLLMGTRGIRWEFFGNFMKQKDIDGNKWNLMQIVWELDENKRILMSYWWEQEEFHVNCLGTWWEQKDIDELLMGTRGIWDFFGNLMKTKGYWWVIDGNLMGTKGLSWVIDGIFLGIWWEHKDFDGILMGTRRIWWEVFGNWIRTKGYWWELLETWWEIKPTPFQKDKKHPFGDMFAPPDWFTLSKKKRNIGAPRMF